MKISSPVFLLLLRSWKKADEEECLLLVSAGFPQNRQGKKRKVVKREVKCGGSGEGLADALAN